MFFDAESAKREAKDDFSSSLLPAAASRWSRVAAKMGHCSPYDGAVGGRRDPLTPNTVPPGMLMLEFLRVLRTLGGDGMHRRAGASRDGTLGRSL